MKLPVSPKPTNSKVSTKPKALAVNPRAHFNPTAPKDTYSLRSYQQRMKQHIIDNPCAFIDAGMSTGKTLVAIDYARTVGGLVIAIYPAAVRHSWFDDMCKFNIDYNFIDLQDTARNNVEMLRNLNTYTGIIGISYAMARSLYTNYNSTRYKAIGFDLSHLNPSAVIVDEGHKLGGYNTKQTLALTVMFKDTPRKVIMSGTLYSDNLLKLWSTSRFLFPRYEGKRKHPLNNTEGMTETYNGYITTYYHYKTFQNRVIPDTPKETAYADISALLKPYTITVRTADVADLPQVNETIQEIPLPPATKNQYDMLANDFTLSYSDEVTIMTKNALTSLTHLQRLSCNGMLEDIDNNPTYFDIKPRLDYLREYISGLGDTPLVIFHRFRRDYDLITQTLDKLKQPYASLTGSHKDMETFIRGKAKIIVVNVGSGSVGVRLNRCGDQDVQHILYYSFNWSNADYQQGISRVVRSDNDAIKVFVTVLLTSGIERRMFDTLMRKQDGQQKMEQHML